MSIEVHGVTVNSLSTFCAPGAVRRVRRYTEMPYGSGLRRLDGDLLEASRGRLGNMEAKFTILQFRLDGVRVIRCCNPKRPTESPNTVLLDQNLLIRRRAGGDFCFESQRFVGVGDVEIPGLHAGKVREELKGFVGFDNVDERHILVPFVK